MGDASGKDMLHVRLWLSCVGFTMMRVLSPAMARDGSWHAGPAGLHPPHGICRGPISSSGPPWRADALGASKELYLPPACPGTT